MVYLIRFSGALGTDRHRAQFYLGWTPDGRLDERLEAHRAGRGARICAAAVARGYTLTVVRTWPGATRADERRFKRRKSHRKLLTAK